MSRPFTPANIAIALSIAIIAAIGYQYAPKSQPNGDLTVEPAPGCNLHQQTCHAELPGGGRVAFAITPHPIPVAKPLQISAMISGVTANKVVIDFSGVKMDMGLNQATLNAQDNSGRYSGEAMIPVCSHGRMAWRATLLIDTDSQRIAIPFLFHAPGEESSMAPDPHDAHQQSKK